MLAGERETAVPVPTRSYAYAQSHKHLNSLGGRQFYKARPKSELEALVEAGVDCIAIGLGGFSMEDVIEQMKILAKDYL